MSFDKFKKEYIPLVKNFDCGNVVINNFLNSENALDFNQGITVDKRLQHTLLVPEAKIYYGDYMSTFVQDSDKNCKKLYKWVDDILEG